MSNLIGLDGRPIGGNDQRMKRLEQGLAAIDQQVKLLQQGLFHNSVLIDFIIEQVNQHLATGGAVPIILDELPAFGEARTKEVIAHLQEHAKARSSTQVELDE